MNILKAIGFFVFGAVVGAFVAYSLVPVGAGGVSQMQKFSFLQGFTAGTSQQLSVDNAGKVTIGSNGTAVDLLDSFTATWNPPSVASSGALMSGTSTAVTIAGGTVGDLCFASLSSDTSTVAHSLTCGVISATAATVSLNNFDSAALDIPTGTLRVDIISH